MPNLTDRELTKGLKDAQSGGEDIYLTDAARARGIGRLRFRARPSGQGLFYFRYVDSVGKQDSIALGVYDIKGRSGLTLSQARDKAGEWSRLYKGGRRDLRAFLDHQDAEQRAKMESDARAREEDERRAKTGTLKAMLDGYVVHLERQGKASAGEARNLFQLNIHDAKAFPHLSAMRASAVTPEDVSAILARMVDRGIGRSAAKLRSYLRAAYGAALYAKHDPTIHRDLHGFHLTSNPAAIVPAKPLAKFNRAGERTLSVPELKAFLEAVDVQPTKLYRDVIWLCLLLGGQRPTQLLRATPADVDMDGLTLTLFDAKGARKQPRTHVLPLTERAAEIVARHLAKRDPDDEPLPCLFTTAGKVPLRVETVSAIVKEIRDAMVKAKTARESFQWRDIRRTCETMLASLGVSKDIRAQILSHGLGGVQDRHYDRHSYMEEKRAVLETWDARLREIETGKKGGNVVQLERKTA